jgi:NAD(P)-dependent dehydrogenase (short-subunit alcohol dehydrogenase family)
MAKHDKVALITGAGSGVGRATAIAFAREGYRLVLAGRRKDALAETITLAKLTKARALAHACDVTDPAAVKALFAACKATFGRLDVLFNNAGVSRGGQIEDVSLEDWAATVATNLSAPFYCTQEAIRLMKAQTPKGGRIINNGSVSATAPRPGSAPYTSTKHAITGLTKSTALDGRKHGVACGQIDIGNALTEMAAKMTKGVPQADGTMKIEPVMDVSNVANAVLHMASLPLDANVLFMTVMATNMPFVGRG